MINYGHATASSASSGTVWCVNNAWRALQVGTTPYTGRKWLKLQVKGSPALAVQFVNKNSSGTFTTPTDTVARHIIYPANSVVVEAIGDGVTVFGRAVGKAGVTVTGARVAVIELK